MIKAGFPFNAQRTHRKERKERYGTDVREARNVRNEMTSLLDRPITAASDDMYAAGTPPSCGRHAIKYEIIEIKFH